jgi:alpha,alpha-trehalose phosphorylase
VITDPRFPIEPWQVRETTVAELDLIAQSESVFALSNGHIGVRGNFDEGDPHGLPGTYLNSFYESQPLPYAEAGYGYPESGQTIVNVTNGKLIRLLVDDEPLDVRYGELLHHERILDFRAGTLTRSLEWRSPGHRQVKVRSTRLVSLSQRAIVAIRYEVEAIDRPIRIVVQSELAANEELPAPALDPRVSARLTNVLLATGHRGTGTRAQLTHQTRSSGLRLAAAMDHELVTEWHYGPRLEIDPDLARLTVGTFLKPGESAVLTKFVAYGWSGTRSAQALQDQVDAALLAGMATGFDGLLAEQRTTLDEFWAGADVEVGGAPAIQQAVRFSLFHAYQAAARAEQRAIPAKGLTGPGYDGHAFWDSEAFVLPLLTATAPDAAADALRWRHSTIELARDRARTLGQSGAAFPWRTIRGEECSAYWPAGSAAVHVNADIAGAAARYVRWTQDAAFERDYALPILVETARLWSGLGYHGIDGHFHIDGVTGPDEYSALGNDNVYTNLTAAQNLQFAAAAAERWPAEAAALQVSEDELAGWVTAAETIAVPFDELRNVHQQDRGFTDRQVWNFGDHQYPLLLNATYFDLYRKQVVKQADLILALHWCGDAFTATQKANAFAYYEPLTVRDSSLSAASQAVIAAEVGQLQLAADYLAESGLMDLEDIEHNTKDGLHIASLAGTWIALVAGFGGLRDTGDELRFRPQMLPGCDRLAFRVRWRGVRVVVEMAEEHVRYRCTADGSDSSKVTIYHGDEAIDLVPDRVVTRDLFRIEPSTPRPTQPPGRAPIGLVGLTKQRLQSS